MGEASLGIYSPNRPVLPRPRIPGYNRVYSLNFMSFSGFRIFALSAIRKIREKLPPLSPHEGIRICRVVFPNRLLMVS